MTGCKTSHTQNKRVYAWFGCWIFLSETTNKETNTLLSRNVFQWYKMINAITACFSLIMVQKHQKNLNLIHFLQTLEY